MSKYFVVLSPSGKEGYITQDADEAEFAATGFHGTGGVSTLAQAFRDVYFEDPDGDDEEDGHIFAEEADIVEVELS